MVTLDHWRARTTPATATGWLQTQRPQQGNWFNVHHQMWWGGEGGEGGAPPSLTSTHLNVGILVGPGCR